MPLHIYISGGRLSFTSGTPFPSGLYELPGADSRFSVGGYGILLVQQHQVENIQVLYTIIKAWENGGLTVSGLHPLFLCHIHLGQPVSVISANGNSFYCRRYSVTLAFSSLSVHTFMLQKSGDYESLSLIYPLSFVIAELEKYTRLSGLRAAVRSSRQTIIADAVIPLNLQILQLTYRLLHLPFSADTRELYGETAKVLFREICAVMNGEKKEYAASSLQDAEGINRVREWIDTHLNKHYTIAELARKAGINGYKLKKGFKEIYGTGVYGYLLRQRLLIAKGELEETDVPVREIARRARYKTADNFSAAFKRMFSISPSRYRQRNRAT